MIKGFIKKSTKEKITENKEKKSDVYEHVYHTPSDREISDFRCNLLGKMIEARDNKKLTIKEIERLENNAAADEYIMDLFDFLVPMGYKLAVVPIEKSINNIDG